MHAAATDWTGLRTKNCWPPGRGSLAGPGIVDPPPAPWNEARHNWILGSERFVDRLRVIVQGRTRRDVRREERLLRGVGLERVLEAVCRHYGVDKTELARRGSRSPARAALAYVARQHTEATLSELVPILGLSRPESVPNLSRRFSRLLAEQAAARHDLASMERQMEIG
jgi:hypothetical protein